MLKAVYKMHWYCIWSISGIILFSECNAALDKTEAEIELEENEPH